jgi:hypothetical protein
MSSTAVSGFGRDIKARNVKAVRERLGNVRGESPNQRFIDPAAAGRVYTLLHKVCAAFVEEGRWSLCRAAGCVSTHHTQAFQLERCMLN